MYDLSAQLFESRSAIVTLLSRGCFQRSLCIMLGKIVNGLRYNKIHIREDTAGQTSIMPPIEADSLYSYS
jgi:hypothetical protein